MPDDIRINISSNFTSEGAGKVQSDARQLRDEFQQLADSVNEADAALRERYASAVEEAARQTARAAETMAQQGGLFGPTPQAGTQPGMTSADAARQAAATAQMGPWSTLINQAMPFGGPIGGLTPSADAARQAALTAQMGPVMAQMGPFGGMLFADVARQALRAGDIPVATQALMRGYRENEPRGILDRLQRELLEARRAAAGVDPSGETEPEAAFSPRLATELRRRIESAVPTIEANLITGRAGQADRSLSLAEQYLEQLRLLEGNTAELRALGEILGKHRESVDDLRQQQERRAVTADGQAAPGADAGGLADEIGSILMARGLAGAGGAGAMMARLAKFLGPWGIAGLAGTAVVGGANWLTGFLGDAAREGRQEAIGFLDLQRAFQSADIYTEFLSMGRREDLAPFATRGELRDLHFSIRDAGEFISRFGLMAPRSQVIPEGYLPTDPSAWGGTWADQQALSDRRRVEGLFGTARAGLELARYTGTDPGMIADLFRQAGIAGVASPHTFGFDAMASILYQAVRDGTLDGVSAAEVFSSIERYLSDLQARGVTGDPSSMATFVALLDAMREGGTRALAGQMGERALTGLVQGMTGVGQPGLEMIALQAVGVGGNLPSGRELGLEPHLAESYDRLAATSPLLAGRFLLEQAQAFNPAVLPRLAAGFERVFGGRRDLEFIIGQQMGLSGQQVLELQGTHGSIFSFLQRATPEELQRLSGAQVRDVEQGVLTGRLAGVGYQQALVDEEIARVKSLNVAVQGLDQAMRDLTENIWGLVNHELWGPILRSDPVIGPQIEERERQRYQDRQEYRRDRGMQQALARTGADLALFGDDVALVEHTANVLKMLESGGNYQAVNYSANPNDPALGAYQILWSNLQGGARPGARGWDTVHLGRALTQEEFLANPMYQRQIARGQLMEYLEQLPEGLSTEERARRLAAAWYAGPSGLRADPAQLPDTPITYEGVAHAYPSQYEYNQRFWRAFTGTPAQPAAPPSGYTPRPAALPAGEGAWRTEGGVRFYNPSDREIARLAAHLISAGVDESMAHGMARARLINEGPGVLHDLPEGYRGGGFTGHGPEHRVAGLVHHGEFVVRADRTQQHRQLLERLNAGADDAQLLSALLPISDRPAGGVGVVRLEGQGELRITVDERVPEGARLGRYLNEGVQRWQREIRSPYNQGARRG